METYYKILVYAHIISVAIVCWQLNNRAELKRSKSNHPTARKITR
jgi:uncharacterized membrane protein SirB2